ncbi:MAG: DNA alkylation repair protein, partial [Muribaculaceae bacterium]|nr:DNA alkylation repair protein [Muribaculaceae bacterium]
AAGWMLREAWKKGYKDELREFLGENVHRMPSVMLSYSCEQMPTDERHQWHCCRKSTLMNKAY